MAPPPQVPFDGSEAVNMDETQTLPAILPSMDTGRERQTRSTPEGEPSEDDQGSDSDPPDEEKEIREPHIEQPDKTRHL
jgi:hypothetical protein